MEAVMWLTFALALTADAATVSCVEVTLGAPNHGIVEGTVDVPVAEVLAIVLDCAASDDWFPDLVGTRVVGVDGDTVRCGGSTNLPWPMPDRTWQIDSHAD